MGLADRFVFQQDLDPKHTASAVRDFFAAEICGSAVVVDSGLISSNHQKSEQNNNFFYQLLKQCLVFKNINSINL
jgi:hypothetical protein